MLSNSRTFLDSSAGIKTSCTFLRAGGLRCPIRIQGPVRGPCRQPNKRYLGHEQFPANHVFEALQHEFDSLIKRDQKTGHLGVGYGQLTRVPLLDEQRNDASPASNDVPVTHDGIGGASSPGIAVGSDEDFVRTELGRSIKIHGVDRLVGAQGNDFDSRPNGRSTALVAPLTLVLMNS